MFRQQWTVILLTSLYASVALASIKGKVVSVDGKPISNAKVICQFYEGEEKVKQFITQTDAQGQFFFPEIVITPESYGASLSVVAEGYGIGGCFIRSPNPSLRFSEETLPPDRPVTLTLFPETILEFRTVDEKGQPVEGVKVTVTTVILPLAPHFREFFEIPYPTWLGVTTEEADKLGLVAFSDANGFVRLRHLPVGGTVHLQLEHHHFGCIKKPADTDEPEIQLSRDPLTVIPDIVLEEPGEVEGEVRYEDGSPAAGVLLFWRNPSGWLRGEVVVDEHGRYRLTKMQPHHYEISLHYQDQKTRDWVSQPPNIRFNIRSGQKVSLPPLKLVKGGILEGLVTDVETGKPIANVFIGVQQEVFQADAPLSVWVASTKTGEDGRYRVRVPPGEFELYIGPPPGYLPPVTEEEMLLGRNPYRGAMKTGETVRMDIQLRRGLELKGRVVDEKGNPIADAVVINLTSFPVTEQVVTDKQGYFVLTNIAPLKEIRLRAYSGDLRTRNDVVVFADEPKAKHVELKVLKGQKPIVKGRVTDEFGKPIAGAEISVSWFSPVRTITKKLMALTDAQGRFELIGLWVGDHYKLSIQADGYGDATVELTPLKPGEVRDIGTVKLVQAGVILSGYVFGEEGPIQGATVYTFMAGDRIKASRTNRDGQFTLIGLSPGQYEIVVREPMRYGWLNLKVMVGAQEGELSLLSVDSLRANPVSIEVKKGQLHIYLRPVVPEEEEKRQSTKAEIEFRPPEIGKPAPDFSVQLWLNSKPLTLSSLRGKVIVLNFCDWFG